MRADAPSFRVSDRFVPSMVHERVEISKEYATNAVFITLFGRRFQVLSLIFPRGKQQVDSKSTALLTSNISRPVHLCADGGAPRPPQRLYSLHSTEGSATFRSNAATLIRFPVSFPLAVHSLPELDLLQVADNRSSGVLVQTGGAPHVYTSSTPPNDLLHFGAKQRH